MKTTHRCEMRHSKPLEQSQPTDAFIASDSNKTSLGHGSSPAASPSRRHCRNTELRASTAGTRDPRVIPAANAPTAIIQHDDTVRASEKSIPSEELVSGWPCVASRLRSTRTRTRRETATTRAGAGRRAMGAGAGCRGWKLTCARRRRWW